MNRMGRVHQMTKKIISRSALSAAVASTLALSAAMSPAATLAAKRNWASDHRVGTQAIIGTGKDAIIGTGKDAIIGTGKSAASVVLRGPASSYDAKTNTAVLFGRKLQLSTSSTTASALRQAVASGQTIELTVLGRIGRQGQLRQASAAVIAGQYVPGASQVVVSGVVTSLDATTATAMIGHSRVDYSSLLADRDVQLTLGEVVTVVGTLPELDQVVLATELLEQPQ